MVLLQTDGKAVSGFQTINRQNLYFHEYGATSQRDNWLLLVANHYFDPNTGDKWVHRSLTLNSTDLTLIAMVVATTKADQTTNRNQFVRGTDQEWYYYDANGKKVTGFQTN